MADALFAFYIATLFLTCDNQLAHKLLTRLLLTAVSITKYVQGDSRRGQRKLASPPLLVLVANCFIQNSLKEPWKNFEYSLPLGVPWAMCPPPPPLCGAMSAAALSTPCHLHSAAETLNLQTNWKIQVPSYMTLCRLVTNFSLYQYTRCYMSEDFNFLLQPLW
jgi:hypothetical protein